VWITPADLRAAGERAALRKIDALLLSGGRDIDPRMYAETIAPGLDVDVDADRYEVEIPLGRAVLEEGMPVLGICGGMQVLNVAAGGSLYQDISLLGVDPAVHRVKGQDAFHEIRVVPGSRLAEILGRSELGVNSAHHQAIKQPGRGALITAAALDGVIEAIEFPGPTLAIGVEWHPERMPDDEYQRRVFHSLIAAARAAHSRSRA
jgi:putative glutamine amidotransferase